MAITRSEIAAIYVSTLNRAADADGLLYWETESAAGDITEFANAFFQSPEAQTSGCLLNNLSGCFVSVRRILGINSLTPVRGFR